MARAVSAMLVLGVLVVAAFCMSEASAVDSKAALLPLRLRLVVNNKCSEAVRVLVDVGNVLDCKAGKVAVLGPVTLKLNLLHTLKLGLFVFDKNGNVVKVKAVVDLGLLGTVLGLLTELVLEVVEEVVLEGKVIKFLCGKVVVAQVLLKVAL